MVTLSALDFSGENGVASAAIRIASVLDAADRGGYSKNPEEVVELITRQAALSVNLKFKEGGRT